MNFKKHCMSAIEPILFTVVLFLAVLAVAALCSPIDKDQLFTHSGTQLESRSEG